MKKLILLVLLFVPIISSAQKIDSDKTKNDTRIISTSSKSIGTKATLLGHKNISFSFLVNATKDSTFYELFVTYLCSENLNNDRPEINKGNSLLLKKEDGNIIELHNKTKIGLRDSYPLLKGRYIYYITIPIYTITREQINDIIKNDIIKVRIETDSNPIDMEISKGKISKIFKKNMQLIDNALKNKKSAYKDF